MKNSWRKLSRKKSVKDVLSLSGSPRQFHLWDDLGQSHKAPPLGTLALSILLLKHKCSGGNLNPPRLEIRLFFSNRRYEVSFALRIRMLFIHSTNGFWRHRCELFSQRLQRFASKSEHNNITKYIYTHKALFLFIETKIYPGIWSPPPSHMFKAKHWDNSDTSLHFSYLLLQELFPFWHLSPSSLDLLPLILSSANPDFPLKFSQLSRPNSFL